VEIDKGERELTRGNMPIYRKKSLCPEKRSRKKKQLPGKEVGLLQRKPIGGGKVGGVLPQLWLEMFPRRRRKLGAT